MQSHATRNFIKSFRIPFPLVSSHLVLMLALTGILMIKFCHLRCLPPLDVVFVTFFSNYVLIKVRRLVHFGCAVIIALVLVLH